MAVGLFIARVMLGIAMGAHGVQKAFGWFGGTGLKATSNYFEWLGYRPGALFAVLAGIAELTSCLLLLLGFLGPLGPALVLVVMLVIAGIFVNNGFFAQHKGYELSFMYMACAVAVAFGGYGGWSLDHLFGIDKAISPAIVWAALGVGTAVGLVNVSLRRAEKPAHATTDSSASHGRTDSKAGSKAQ